MADEQQQEVVVNEGKGGGGMKTLIIVFVVLLAEGGLVAVVAWLAGGPKAGEAAELKDDPNSAENQTVEVMLIKDRFLNTRTGQNYLYDSEIYVTLRAANKGEVEKLLESKKAQIKFEVATIYRRALPQHFKEEAWSTLRRQIKSVLEPHFGKDEQERPIIKEVLITRCDPFRADF